MRGTETGLTEIGGLIGVIIGTDMTPWTEIMIEV